MNPIVDPSGRLRNGWWILFFFLFLAAMLVPLIIVSSSRGGTVSVAVQAAIVALASGVCQWLRRRPLTEVSGRFDRRWLLELLAGLALGAAIMLAAAAFLGVSGFATWRLGGLALSAVASAIPAVAAVAVTEELLFRGFVFQRLVDGIGALFAQLIVGAFFVLTHAAALEAAGEVRNLAAVNIFIASLLFGLAFLRTRSLAMPLGIHFAANFTQGTVLGFGVSGHGGSGLLVPSIDGPPWMTGAAFGLEASLPGLVAIAIAAWMVYRWRGTSRVSRPIGKEDVVTSAMAT